MAFNAWLYREYVLCLPSTSVTYGCVHDYGRLQLVAEMVIFSAHLTHLLSYSTRSKIDQPLSFKFFSYYLACYFLCIHTSTTFIQTSSRETRDWLFFTSLFPCCQLRTGSQDLRTQFIFHRICFDSSLFPLVPPKPTFKILDLTPKLSNITQDCQNTNPPPPIS